MSRNVLVLGTGQGLNLIASLVMAVMLPRYLGDVGLGRLSFAIATIAICGLLARFGTETFLTKQIAVRREAASSYVVNGLALRVPLLVITSLLVIVLANVAGLNGVTKQLVYVALVAMMLEAMANVLAAALQGLEDMTPVARVLAFGKVVQAIVVVILLLKGYGVVEVAAALSISGFLSLILWGAYFLRQFEVRAKIDPALCLQILRGGFPFLIWQASLFIYGQIDIVLLSLFTRDAVVGWYSASYRLVNVAIVIPAIIAAASLPALSAFASKDKYQVQRLANHATRLVLVATIPVSVGLMVTADRIISFLGFPEEFAHSVPIMIIVAASIPFVSIDMVIGNALIATNKQTSWAVISSAAAIVNLCLNCAAIPIAEHFLDNGGVGAAIATLATELFVMAAGVRLVGGRKVVFDDANRIFGLKCTCSAIVMGALVLLMPFVHIVLIALGGACIYVVFLVVLHVTSLKELRGLVNMTVRSLHEGAARKR